LEIIEKYFSDFTPQQVKQFSQLKELYTEWNEKINVISRKDIDFLYERHVLHSLAIAAICNFEPGAQVIDIGTGGGFPGIPLAIFYPDVQFTLVDSIGKKIKVVEEVAAATELTNVRAIHGRAEQVNAKFDFAVSRAVAPLGELWNWINLSVRKGRRSGTLANGLICLKGGDLDKEIKESGLSNIVQAWSVQDIFPEPHFEEKFLIYVPKK
jgi:16S rRNA (guanine527-N7)-methyltransferase